MLPELPALRLAVSLWWFWSLNGHVREAREYRPGAGNFRAATLWVHGLMDRNVQAITVSGFFDRLPAGTPHKGLFGQWEHNFPDRHFRSVEFQHP